MTEDCDYYLALLKKVDAAITFETEEQARQSAYGLPPQLAQDIHLAIQPGFTEYYTEYMKGLPNLHFDIDEPTEGESNTRS